MSDEIRDYAIDNVNEIDYDPGGTEGEAVDRLLTIQEVCELLKVRKAYIYSLTHKRKIPYIKIQGILRFRQSAYR